MARPSSEGLAPARWPGAHPSNGQRQRDQEQGVLLGGKGQAEGEAGDKPAPGGGGPQRGQRPHDQHRVGERGAGEQDVKGREGEQERGQGAGTKGPYKPPPQAIEEGDAEQAGRPGWAGARRTRCDQRRSGCRPACTGRGAACPPARSSSSGSPSGMQQRPAGIERFVGVKAVRGQRDHAQGKAEQQEGG